MHNEPDDIDLSDFYLPRKELVSRVFSACSRYQFVSVSSPAGTGKTSLMRLMSSRAPNCIYIRCGMNDEWLQTLQQHGIDLIYQKISIPEQGPNLLIVIDDAQLSYRKEDELIFLIKGAQAPSRVRFIISATHALRSTADTPIRFGEVFGRGDLLLSDDEADQLLKSMYGLPTCAHNYKNLLYTIKRDCDGHAAALITSVQALEKIASKDDEAVGGLGESTMLSKFYSSSVTFSMRCSFGEKFSAPGGTFLELLQRSLFEWNLLNFFRLGTEEQRACKQLLEAGILVETSVLTFSSPMAVRIFSYYLFPTRNYSNPGSLKDLLIGTIKSLSASKLQQSTASTVDFPKAATFRYLILRSMYALTYLTCYIRPKLPLWLDKKAEEIEGELDFHLSGPLNWGIRLLVQGQPEGSGQGGQHYPSNVRDYVVLDLRPGRDIDPSSISRELNRCTVLFSEDFERCECVYGLDDVIGVELE